MRPTDPKETVGPEPRDVPARGILWFGFGMIVASVVISVMVWGFFRLLAARENRRDEPLSPLVAANLRRTPPEPRLEALPLAPRQRLDAEERARLSSYAWIDRAGGVARIPIERAIQILLSRGLPRTGTEVLPPVPVATPGSPPAAAAPGGRGR